MKKFTKAALLASSFIYATSGYASTLTDTEKNTVWLEAESFADKGGWVIDQQYMDLMGSPYLMAHGLGVPVNDAVTTIDVPEAGNYNVYVRTYNWTSPWYSGEGPGKFKVSVNGKKLKETVGTEGHAWQWQKAGNIRLGKGKATVALHDMTGFNGRCDAIVLTTERNPVLPDGGDGLRAIRRKAQRKDSASIKAKNFDFVVVGGGIAGMCAAVTAARNGLKTALVNDRPVLGGNNSSDVRVHLGGYSEIGPNKGLGRMIREFGHSRKGNAKPADFYEDEKKDAFVKAEKNITYFPSFRATEVKMDNGKISQIIIENIENAKELILNAPLFADCTGDGTIGYLAGADYRMGREARDEFGEYLAPEKADSIVMGTSVQWYSVKETDKNRRTFPEFKYGIEFADSTCERVKKGDWQWETGMNRNQLTEAERIRDYGLAVVYANWSYLKNELRDKEFADRSLGWVAYIGGKRESRRLLGDYILKQDDIDKDVSHEDASFTTTWSIDLHFPDTVNTKRFPRNEFKAQTIHRCIHPYAVPYRCLYSRNVDNLFMAGRNISVTHVALGTVRVMRTTGMMGEVVGMAASLCNKHKVSPREVYQDFLAELKTMMKAGAGKDGSTLPDNQNFNRGKKLLTTPRAFLKQTSNGNIDIAE